jgi:hypothetical protein
MDTTHGRLNFDEFMRHLMVVGVLALGAWTVTGLAGVVSGFLTVRTQPTLRFLLAILVLVFARRTYWELCEWRWRRLPTEERLGFANPLLEGVGDTHHHDGAATEPSQGER